MIIRRSIVRLLSPEHMRGRIASVSWIFIGASIGLLVFIPFATKIKKEGDVQGHLTLLDFTYKKFGRRNTTLAASLFLVVFLMIILGTDCVQ